MPNALSLELEGKRGTCLLRIQRWQYIHLMYLCHHARFSIMSHPLCVGGYYSRSPTFNPAHVSLTV